MPHAGLLKVNCDKTLVEVLQLCAEASSNGAQFVLFSEGFFSCYPRGSNFGCFIGNETFEGLDLYRLYWELLISIPGPVADQLLQISKKKNSLSNWCHRKGYWNSLLYHYLLR